MPTYCETATTHINSHFVSRDSRLPCLVRFLPQRRTNCIFNAGKREALRCYHKTKVSGKRSLVLHSPRVQVQSKLRHQNFPSGKQWFSSNKLPKQEAAPVSWKNLAAVMVAGAVAVGYYNYEKERRLTQVSSNKVTTIGEASNWWKVGSC